MIKAAIIAILMSGFSSAAAATLSEARDAYDQNRVPEAVRIYGEVAADRSATADDRAEADIELARIAWLIDGNADLALQRLEVARTTSAKQCDISQMTSRILREAKRDQEAIDAEAALLGTCTQVNKRDAIRTNVMASKLDLANSMPERRQTLLAQVRSETRLLSPEAGAEAARVRLEAGLLSDDAPAALAAWKEYFWLDDGDAPQALEKLAVSRRFTRGLAKNATTEERLALAELLMRAGFGEQSRRYAEAHRLPGSATNTPTWRRLNAYWIERDKLETEILRVNREFAHGRKDNDSLGVAAGSAMANLVKAANASGDPRAALLKHYNLVGTVGLTNGYPSIHLGHLIEDRDEQVTQYGHSAKIHFRSLDNMVSNGFSSWLWDGSAAVGGWTADGVITQVREAYVDGPLTAYRLTQPGPEREKVIARQSKRATEDVAKLKARQVATLEGLGDRLQLQLVDQVMATARTRAVSESEVRRLFLAEYSKANFNQSIFVHEGRHAIDNAIGIGSNVDQAILEERAKLSELALAAYPRMALRNMDRSLEGTGPHDRGAARIFDGYRKWMEAHPGEIMGYDPAIPVLEQLDRLTDAQIREIARSMDPLAQGRTTVE